MMTINNNNDWSVPGTRMGRLKEREQQKVAGKKKKKESPKNSKVPRPKQPKKSNANKKHSKNWLWVLGLLVIIILAVVFFVRRSNNNQAQANAEKIVQKAFNSDRDNITDDATQTQMSALAADAKKVKNNTEANQYSQLASLGKSAINFEQDVANLKNGSNYRESTTGSKVSALLQELKSSSFESDFSGFYNEYNKKLSGLETRAKAVSKLHKQTNDLFVNGKHGTLKASVTTSNLNTLLDSLNKYSNFDLAKKDLARVEKAVKTYGQSQTSSSSEMSSTESYGYDSSNNNQYYDTSNGGNTYSSSSYSSSARSNAAQTQSSSSSSASRAQTNTNSSSSTTSSSASSKATSSSQR
ncbi:hypothetical protein [Pediococcus cellicola]|uniref:Uncharacterized protein n=1 Tax=Pediococcus cellicola TaxID=319652 RepID=A0A0R2IRE3_9LACO|nr:hypothetical protein [Pediococcus cellicola]KRN67627.1 hypothetical protein IV80_GL000170 [Pediococcus cellicola]GEL14383.1 hypothetical protein PCE01_01850 [Pediococcus cellicola]